MFSYDGIPYLPDTPLFEPGSLSRSSLFPDGYVSQSKNLPAEEETKTGVLPISLLKESLLIL